MSDGTRKKIKTAASKVASTNASPGGSRAGSVERDAAGPRALSPGKSFPTMECRALDMLTRIQKLQLPFQARPRSRRLFRRTAFH